jgi:hypothetical protein
MDHNAADRWNSSARRRRQAKCGEIEIVQAEFDINVDVIAIS